MGWKDWPVWKKTGLILGFLAVLLFLIIFLREFIINYISCSKNNWQSMCGTEIVIIGGAYGLGISLLPVFIIGFITEIFIKNHNITYPIEFLALIIGIFITYFLIGALIGRIYEKIKKK